MTFAGCVINFIRLTPGHRRCDIFWFEWALLQNKVKYALNLFSFSDVSVCLPTYSIICFFHFVQTALSRLCLILGT